MRRPRVGDVYQIGAQRFEVTAWLWQPPAWRAIGVASGGGVPAVETQTLVADLERARLMSGGMGEPCPEGDPTRC